MIKEFPLRLPAIKIEQPLGDFFAVSINASILLKTCHTIRAEILNEEDESTNYIGGTLLKIFGNQRVRSPKRLEQIKRYSETVDASFPNSIIIGANYSAEGSWITDESKRWAIEYKSDGSYILVIPSPEKMASIIDGQHRVFGLDGSSAKDMELLCSVYIDLPLAYHAKIFENINTNQKRVDKNLAYNLFQFEMGQGEPSTWSPETLAVYFARVLAFSESSPLKGHIRIGTYNSTANTSISMASFIDGFLSLITNNPKEDRDILHTKSIEDGRSRSLLVNVKCNAPLRKYYLSCQDKSLYNYVMFFFAAVQEKLWKFQQFKTTLGVLACFDFLKAYSVGQDIGELSIKSFEKVFAQVDDVNFLDPFYSVQTKMRTRLKNTLLIRCGIKGLDEISSNDGEKNEYIRLLSK